MADHRQSALLLHGLGAEDQRWILARLAAEDQRILGEHLAELKSLGIPADPATIDTARSSRRRVVADPLHKASAAQMLALLANEPVWMVRQVLALDNWSWKHGFLAAFTPLQQERLAAKQAALPNKLAASLRAQLAQRLAQVDIDLMAPRKPRGLRHVLQQAASRWL